MSGAQATASDGSSAAAAPLH
ncbi:MAG: hypothetical protein RI986_1040, partial [Planctomycetota bacterium]